MIPSQAVKYKFQKKVKSFDWIGLAIYRSLVSCQITEQINVLIVQEKY